MAEAEKEKKLNFVVDRKLHRRVRIMAAMEDRSIAELAREALVEYVDRKSPKAKSQAREAAAV